MYKTYQYRVYPTKEQEGKMEYLLRVCKRLYNRLLEHCNEHYKETGKDLSGFDKKTIVDGWRRESEELQNLSSTQCRDVADRLHKAYDNFFVRIEKGEKPGFPKFRKGNEYRTFGVKQWGNCKVIDDSKRGKVRILGVGELKIVFHRPLEGETKTWNITKTGTDEWYIGFACDIGEAEKLPQTGNKVGVDLGITNLAITSEGEFYPKLEVFRIAEKKIKTAQREVSRRKKGSNRRKKSILKLAKLHEKVARQREWLHRHVANDILEKYDWIAIEDLKVKNMVKNHHLAKSISDAGWGSFVNHLESKANQTGKYVVKVDPRNTSQICSCCGVIVKKKLSERTHSCTECGLVIDRDVNAAINILQRSSEKYSDINEAM